MNELYSVASILNTIFIIAAMVGGYMAIRNGKHQATGAIQSQAIEALQAEVESINRKVADLERENTRLEQTLGLIKQALGKRGMTVSIDGDLVTISDIGAVSQTGRIHLQTERNTEQK